ncbi:MAG TPA: hypothetical protein VIL09_18935 [Microvirga sp.]|jgi:DGQHR domain-containing protein
MQIDCMRTEISSGGSTYPIYIGFARAKDIAAVSVAPAFTLTTPHQAIADNISSQPVREWQRPINNERVSEIATAFNDSGRLMPNPVLLAKNAFATGIKIAPKLIHNIPTGNYIVDIDESATSPDQRPLWILDGQHRITGLSLSAQSDNPVPVVFLLDDPAGSYPSPLLASIFAQVTTAATKLDDLHNEWLTYAFELGRYAKSDDARKSFASVVELCRRASWNGLSNPFFNQIQFNMHASTSPAHGGFSFTCKELAELILKYYYAQPAQVKHLTPDLVALEIARAYTALYQSIQNHDSSVFFHSDKKKQHRIMQEAYLASILTRTLHHGSTPEYKQVLQDLRFPTTNWDFSWHVTLSGPANSVSKRIALKVLSDAIVNRKLPANTQNLADYFRGNGAAVVITCSALGPAGRPIRSGRSEYTALRGSTGSHPVAKNPHLRITDTTSNVGEYQVVDAKRAGRQVEYDQMYRRGLLIDNSIPRPLEVIIMMQHYGGLYSQAEVIFDY